MVKKEKELHPEIIEKNVSLPFIDLSKLNKEIDINTILDTGKEDEDSFFKSVVTQMFNNKDVETKTENQGIRESFFLARLSYLGEKFNCEPMRMFTERVERKRISIGRKGRIELVEALLQRQQELERQRAAEQAKILSGGRV